MMQFIPDAIEAQNITAPFFDDQRENENIRIPGYSVVNPQEYYKDEIIRLLGKLGAGGARFTQGLFKPDGMPQRYGFLITFNMSGVEGKIEALTESKQLPMLKENINV
ncbi:MAG: hypothetical protein KAS32_27880 [Candidatus Peribacteraceae bacterium]|nr:hypothetical protein [Candidatus Peribacteraceae bacterium]